MIEWDRASKEVKTVNSTQIQCFLALSETLNFTKAASKLYLSQPALSRQIVTMEQELNTLLFIRDTKSVRLTPAGALLAGELGEINSAMENLLARAQAVAQGYNGMLTIGVLEGQWLGEALSRLCRTFLHRYPNIDFHLQQGSFSQLRQQLNEGKIDAAVTLDFDIREMHGVVWRLLEPDVAVFAASRGLRLARKETVQIADVLEETVLTISPKDSRAGHDKLMDYLKKLGGLPQRIRYAPNFSTLTLWVEAGLGVGIVNHFSALAQNPAVRLLHEIPLEDASSCIVWRQNNLNPAVDLFVAMVDDCFPNCNNDSLSTETK